jgi:hypothetical protein
MIIFAYSISVLLMIATPVIVAVLLRRRFTTPGFLFLADLGDVYRVANRPHALNEWLAGTSGLLPPLGSAPAPTFWRTALILGLTAGLCEELARTVGYALLRRFRRFEDGVMLGVGHGGIEAMVFGAVQTAAMVTSLLALRGADLTTLNLAADQMTAVTQQLENLNRSPLWAALPWVERCLAMGIHVILSLLVWRAFALRKAWYVPLAIAYHVAFDAVAVYVAQQTESVVIIYGTILLLIAPGLLWLWRIWRRKPGRVPSPPRCAPNGAVSSPPPQGAVATMAHQARHRGRRRRLCFHRPVFAARRQVHAGNHPLSAGAEQFADLIPTPSVGDVMTQYVKNLTQFGFMIAILLGYGRWWPGKEKEGTAALILCKRCRAGRLWAAVRRANAALHRRILRCGTLHALLHVVPVWPGGSGRVPGQQPAAPGVV